MFSGEKKALKILGGNSNPELVKNICSALQISPIKAEIKKFSDGEISLDIFESVRGNDIFVIESTCPPVNDNLMELLIMLDALKRASAGRITAVMPYYGYARQDRKVSPRAPITAKLVANLLTAAGAERILNVELHAGQIQGFFDIPVDNLFVIRLIADHLLSEEKFKKETIIVSPDSGGVARARALAKRLNSDIAVVDKRRDAPNICKVLRIVGEVAGKTAIIIDDMVDTAGTLIEAANALNDEGASAVYGCCVHPVLSGSALERINNSVMQELLVTDTIPLKEEVKRCEKIKLISVAGLLAGAIKEIHLEGSVSSLFQPPNESK